MEKTRILIVEDDNIIALEIQSRLEEQGYFVLGPYAYGEEVIENINNLKVNLILMDIHLKGSLDGIETAKLIKENFKIPVIYLTAYTDHNTLDRAKITEPFGYIIKPFEERELFTNIEMALYKHKIELKLYESEQWLQTTLKSIGDGVIATDLDSNIKFMNKVAENLTGWTLEEATGRKLVDVFNIVNERTRSTAKNPVERVIKEGIHVGLANHTLLINKEGMEIPISDTASPIKDNSGNVSGCVLVFQDHTEKRNYQLALEESESKYRTTLESMDDGIYVVDKNLNVVLANNTLKSWTESNDKSVKRLNLGFEEFKDNKPDISNKIDQLQPFVNEKTIADLNRTFKTLQPYFKEEEFFVNGSKFYTETKIIPIYGNDSDTKLVTIIKDITEKKINIDEIKQSKFLLQSILDFTPAIVYIKDLTGKYQLINKKFEQVFNTSNENVREKNDNELFDNATAEILSRNDNSLKEESNIINYEEMIIDEDYNFHTYLFSKFLLFDSYGNQTGICTIAIDITHRKKAEEEISNLNLNLEKRVLERTEQLNKVNLELKIENEKRKEIHIELMNKQKQLAVSLEKEKDLNLLKNDFIMMISHEYRTPLSVILLTVNILERQYNEGQKFTYELDKIKSSVKRMTNLLEESISLRKYNSGYVKLKPENFDLIKFIESIIEENKIIENERHIYSFNHGLSTLNVINDKESLHHIIGNIINNASKYSGKDTKITITLEEKEKEKLIIKVIDNGKGIPKNDLKNIFESFFRSNNVSTISGFGLGLSIVKKNLELIGGEIFVESEPLKSGVSEYENSANSGTTFTIIIPKSVKVN